MGRRDEFKFERRAGWKSELLDQRLLTNTIFDVVSCSSEASHRTGFLMCRCLSFVADFSRNSSGLAREKL